MATITLGSACEKSEKMKCYNNVNKKIYNFIFINNKIEGVKI